MTTSSPKARAREARMKAEAQIEALYKVAQPKHGKDDHNPLAMMGESVTDEEYVEEFGIPSEFAKTRSLNDYMLDKVQTENERFYESE